MRPQPVGATAPLPPSLEVAPQLLAMRPRAIWTALRKQPISVWSLYVYLFLEYVRPQTVYPALNVLPWAQLALLTAVGSALLLELGKRRWTFLDTALVLYTIIVLASLLTAFDPKFGIDNLDLYISWILVYFAISTTVNNPTRVMLMLLGWFLWNLKMTQHGFRSWAGAGFGFRDWGVTGGPGWFQNSGEFGIQTCVIMPISLFFALGVRRHVSQPVFIALLVLPFTAVASAIASSSRGALLGMLAVGIWMVLRSRYRVRGIIGLVVLAGTAYLFVPEEQRARLSESGEDNTSVSRLMYWSRGIEFANERPLLGLGYKGWMPAYTYYWGDQLEKGQRVQLPHNFAVEALSELGYLGLGALLLLLGGTFFLNARTRALARRLGDRGRLMEHLASGFDGGLIGFMVSGFFVTVLYYPYLWVNLGMTVALHLTVKRVTRAARLAQAASGELEPARRQQVVGSPIPASSP